MNPILSVCPYQAKRESESASVSEKKVTTNKGNNHSFIVRFWLEPRELDNARPIWRGVVEHVATGEKLYLKNLEEVKQFIVSYLPETVVFQDKINSKIK